MANVRRSDPTPRLHWLDVLIAPLTWVERARGWRRPALLALYVMLGGIVGREVALWPLPAIPEPVDPARFGQVDLPAADNAQVLYREAIAVLVPIDPTASVKPDRPAWYEGDWARAVPAIRGWVEANRPALDLWLRGTARPDARALAPARPIPATGPTAQADLATLDQLGTLEATRRRGAGDLAGAWAYHRGVIRYWLHVARDARSAPAIAVALNIRRSSAPTQAWVDDPAQTPGLLRAALADLAACRPLVPTPADGVRADYLATRDRLDDPGFWAEYRLARNRGISRDWHDPTAPVEWAREFWRNEPKRSHRVHRLVVAGLLADCARPVGDHPPLVDGSHSIYAVDAATPRPPPPDRAQSPGRLGPRLGA